MDNQEPTYEQLVDHNLQLTKEIWQLRAHVAQRELHILDLTQLIRDNSKEKSTVIDE